MGKTILDEIDEYFAKVDPKTLKRALEQAGFVVGPITLKGVKRSDETNERECHSEEDTEAKTT